MKIDMASAMGSVFSAAKKKVVAPVTAADHLQQQRTLWYRPGAKKVIKGSISTVCMKNRQKVISSQPHSAPSLANASACNHQH